MTINNSQSTVVVVGGGLAGLTTACYLARAGVGVTLLEQASQLGGSAATQHHAGYAFNRGLHALYSGGAATEVLRELGVAYHSAVPSDVWMLQGDKLHPFPANPITLLMHPVLSVGDKLELMRVFATLPRLVPATLAYCSVKEWIAQTLRRPQPRALLTAFAHTFVYSTALDLVSAEVFVDKLQRALKHPVQYIDGGWQTLVDGLRQVAEQAGARIISDTRADRVVCDAGQVEAVQLRDNTMLPADAVVLAVRPSDALKLVARAVAPALHSAVERLVPAPIACLDVALARLPNARHPVVQDVDQPRFVSAQSVYARIAPPEGALVGAFKQLDPRVGSDPEADMYDLEALLDMVQPGWRNVLVKRVFLPHIVACGALPTAQDGGFAGRPGAQVAGLANLYLAGDWIGAEGFLADASFASGREAARLVLRDSALSRRAAYAEVV